MATTGDAAEPAARDLEAAARVLREAHRVTVLTGAGMSADSGVPTFRDPQDGLWAHHRPEDIATPEAFARDPAGVWAWYAARRAGLAHVEPHAGHYALAALERDWPDVRVITQNVDGLHQRAGSANVIEFHGNITRDVCHREGRTVDVGDDTGEPPACPHCGGPVRPGVVWFGEAIPPQALEGATEAASACDTFLVVGTAAEVEPAASLAAMARRAGATLVEINPDPAELGTTADVRIAARAVDALPALLQRIGPTGSGRGGSPTP